MENKERLDKVIFLDFDGVLNTLYYHCHVVIPRHRKEKVLKRTYEDDFDPKRLKILREICAKTGAKVVVTSSWRNDKEAIKYLKERKIPIIGTTPEALRRGHRGSEIIKFLSEHDVGKYVIFDDDSNWYSKEMMEHAIITRETDDKESREYNDCFEGLQTKHIKWAIAMLGERND